MPASVLTAVKLMGLPGQMAVADGLTVMVGCTWVLMVSVISMLSWQPAAEVAIYLMVAVPVATPVARPLDEIVAMDGCRLFHWPVALAVALVSCVVAPGQMPKLPVVGAMVGLGLNVTDMGALVTVALVIHPASAEGVSTTDTASPGFNVAGV